MANSIILIPLIAALDKSINSFEKAIGVGTSTITKALKRKSDIKPDTVEKILKAFPNVSKRYLETGHGEMLVHNDANERNPPQGQGSEDKMHYATPTSLDLLIKANADQSQAVKDIAAANIELVMMLKEEKKQVAIAGDAQHTAPAFAATQEDLQAAVIKALLRLGYDTPEARRAKEHIAAKETAK